MSLIACTDPCVYQKDGRCTLSRAASAGVPEQSRCIDFVPARTSQQSVHSLSDISYSDQL